MFKRLESSQQAHDIGAVTIPVIRSGELRHGPQSGGVRCWPWGLRRHSLSSPPSVLLFRKAKPKKMGAGAPAGFSAVAPWPELQGAFSPAPAGPCVCEGPGGLCMGTVPRVVGTRLWTLLQSHGLLYAGGSHLTGKKETLGLHYAGFFFPLVMSAHK